jgi:acetoin utilization deacetylase AcuC-like enzyme
MTAPRTGVVAGSQFRAHQTGAGHPEEPERSAIVEKVIQNWEGPALHPIHTRPATSAEILRIHDQKHLARIAATQYESRTRLDADTMASQASYATALEAAGGLLELVDAIDSGDIRNGFAFVRPPGHHATRTRSQGFCLFNNVAIAASHLRQKYDRIAILDFDVHHGNGTEEIFREDPHVFYASLHEAPWYPGTGAWTDIGTGAGAGYTANVPLLAGAGDPEARLAMNDLLLPILYAYAPQFVLVSAGFDGHHKDPLGNLEYSETGFHALLTQLRILAENTASGRLAAVLEGGYDAGALASCADASLAALTTSRLGERWKDTPRTDTLAMRETHQALGPLA